MSGRGRPRRAKSPEPKDDKKASTTTKREVLSPSSCTRKTLPEEKLTPAMKEQATKKKGLKQDKSLEDYTAVMKTQTKTTKDTTRRKSAKEYSGRPTSSEAADDEQLKQTTGAKPLTTVQSDEEETNNHTARRPKICRVRARSPREEREDKKDSKTLIDCKPKVRTHGERAKSPTEEVVVDMSIKQLCLKNNKKTDAAKKVEARHLYATLEKLKIRKTERSESAKVINEIQEVILKHLRKNTQCFKLVQEPLRTGSYYENLKISNPDEYDIMFPIVVERVDMQPFSEDGAYYSVLLKRGNSLLKKFQPDSQPLSAYDMLNEFRNEVIESVKKHPGVVINRKKRGCPAVTLTIEVDSRPVSLDVVLSLAVKASWPSSTNDGFQIEEWLGRKVKQNYKWGPFYLVSKYEGKATAENNGVLAKDTWRVSFSHVEKDILKNHGSEKTCCEKEGVPCCRKDCLKLLKYLLGLLKDQDKSFDKFCSYHAKTTLFRACSSRPKDSQWAAADLSQCFDQLLKDFEGHLQQGQLYNFFIPTQNLLSGCSQKSCRSLAMRVKQEREHGFPIFSQN